MNLSPNAVEILKRRYLLRDSKGNIIETPEKMFRRAAKHIAKAESLYRGDPKKAEKDFYSVMANLDFLPNSPTLMNAGTEIGQLSACFVLPVEDSLESIFNTLKLSALIHQTGGGTGFSFSRIRPRGDIVGSTKGIASGPVSFMEIYDKTTDVIKQGGKRRGANMGILRVDHPDIIEFIHAKEKERAFNNFNLSVGITDRFMKSVKENKKYDLINPRTGKSEKKADAGKIFNSIVEMAWKTGDPGIVFLDEMNRKHPLKDLGMIESTNPCGEIPLLPYESCNLGSINLVNMVSGGKIDYRKLRKTVQVAVHFLDNVIDANKYPSKNIEEMTKANRKIGLGVMGFADMLILLGISYDSVKAVKTASRIMKFISNEARNASIWLAKKRGVFPNFRKSSLSKKYREIRNATLTTIAPTGTISIIADCSNGIEPVFAVSFRRKVIGGKELTQISPVFEKIAKEKGFYSRKMMQKIALKDSIKNIMEIPKDIRRLFVTAHDIKPEWHVKMQAAFQKHVDNAVSKTVNLRKSSSKEDIKKIFLMAYRLGCKGITVYREGSKKEKVLMAGKCKVCV